MSPSLSSNTAKSPLNQKSGIASGFQPHWLIRHSCWIFPFSVFLVTRLFSGFPELLVIADQCKYLALGRSFPFHCVDNHSLFLMHPPAFGWTIGALGLFLPLLTAGLLASILFAMANFAAIWAYGRSNGICHLALMAGMLLLALDRNGIMFDTHVSRVPAMLLSFTLGLWAFERWLAGARWGMAMALGANLLAHLISDQALQLIPCQIVIFLLNQHRRTLRHGLGFLAATAAIFCVWPAVRLGVYLAHDTYPAGIDGTIEFTSPVPWLGVIQPNLLPATHQMVSEAGMRMSFENFDITRIFKRATHFELIPHALAVVMVAILVGAAFLRRERWRQSSKWLLLTILLYLPTCMGLLSWYGMGFVVTFYLLLAEGCQSIIGVFRRPLVIQLLLASAAVGTMVVWLSPRPNSPPKLLDAKPGQHFLFCRVPITPTVSLRPYLTDTAGVECIMAPVGVTPHLVYLTGKRVVALPADPELVDRFVREYRVTHLVIPASMVSASRPPVHASRPSPESSADYVKEHPERYRLRLVTDENNLPGLPPERYVLLEVVDAHTVTTR